VSTPVDRSRPREKVAAHQATGDGVTRVPYPIGVRSVMVTRRTEVAPRMLRLTLAGESLRGLHTYQADDHVRVLVPEEDGSVRAPTPRDDGLLDWPKPWPPSRCYTIRRFDPESLELDLDFVRHEGGIAAAFAENIEVGEEIVIAGPPGVKVFPHHLGHYVFVVDFTALPAAARWLEERPTGARTTVLAVIDDPSDREYPVTARDGDRIDWLLPEDSLEERLTDIPTEPDSFVFAAGEAGMVKVVRGWAKGAGLPLLPTGYWKRGTGDFED
jgi:NADPH-dependent ferric siderophore reductase